ncbi:MAG: right-handed parallel beta-helix repeat-containing protein, partial [Candidatus Saliniplasma sp.]
MDKTDILCVIAIISLLFNSSIISLFHGRVDIEDEMNLDMSSDEERDTGFDPSSRDLLQRMKEEGEGEEKPYWRYYENSVEEFMRPSPRDEHSDMDIKESSINPHPSNSTDTSATISADYEEHPRIVINSDTELADYVESEGWSGDGTEDDPYIIGGLAVDGRGHDSGIFMGNVTDHFFLEDCYIFNATRSTGGGLVLDNTNNGNIVNNTFSENSFGILIRDSSQNLIENNDIFDNFEGGSLVGGSTNIDIENNSIWDNGKGIYVFGGYDNNLSTNRVENNGIGIALDDDTRENNIFSNEVLDNSEGLILYESDSNLIDTNEFLNGQHGIKISSSSQNQVFNNTIADASKGGIVLDTSNYNVVLDNSMHNCGIFIQGSALDHWNTHEIESSNEVNRDPVHYVKNQVGG